MFGRSPAPLVFLIPGIIRACLAPILTCAWESLVDYPYFGTCRRSQLEASDQVTARLRADVIFKLASQCPSLRQTLWSPAHSIPLKLSSLKNFVARQNKYGTKIPTRARFTQHLALSQRKPCFQSDGIPVVFERHYFA